MATEYVKRTKHNVDFPNSMLWHLTAIKERLKLQNWKMKDNPSKGAIAVTISETYPYCSDAVALVERLLSNDVWRIKMTNYEAQESIVCEGKKWYMYTWNYTRLKKEG